MLKITFQITIFLLFSLNLSAKVISNEIDSSSKKIVTSILQKAKENKWHHLNYSNLIISIASEFIGTPYIGGTLEGGYEVCRINLNGLDCVTFVENVLNLSRIIKQEKYSIDDLFEAITQTRYRNGIIEDYTSRLHYTADWIYQNVKNQILQDITPQFGGERIKFAVDFMSKNPKYYTSLVNNPDLISKIESQEKEINSRTYYNIPKSKINKIENKLQEGDIICILTNKPGLDYAHLGLVYKDSNGSTKLMHASLSQKKVVIDTSITEYLDTVKSHIGITVLRPMEPKTND